jgi:hypothetical protein
MNEVSEAHSGFDQPDDTEHERGHAPDSCLLVSQLVSHLGHLRSLAPNLFDLSLKHLANIARYLVR